MSGESYISLSELQRRIKSAVETALPMPVWVAAEIAEVKVNYSGHCYMELVEKAEPSASARRRNSEAVPRAQARAVIWRSQYAMISSYFEAETGSRLEAGMKILARVLVSYHELYGLTLQIVDLDASYTLGEVERERRQTILRLQADGVWDMNRETAMPLLVQRIAVVSSAAAAGYRDFCNELRGGCYAFVVTLFDAVVQGAAAEDSIVAALCAVAERAEEFDAVVLIRGGGSASDLSCFNSYRLCSYVAQFPTAVAAWLTERMARSETWLDESARRLREMTEARTRAEALHLERLAADVAHGAAAVVAAGRARMDLLREQLAEAVQRRIESERQRLAVAEGVVEGRNPRHIMRMGFAVVRRGADVLTQAAQVTAGESLHVELYEGELDVRVTGCHAGAKDAGRD